MSFVQTLSKFEIYLIIINVVGFIVYLINTLLYRYSSDSQIDKLVTIVAFIGGSAGIILSILIFDRKAEKGNMMSRVFVACIFVIQIIVLLIIKGHVADHLTLAFWDFFNDNKILIYYLVIINFISLAVYGVDKINAAEGRTRIRIVTLLGLAFIGGSIGAIIAMYLFHHKTRKDYFTVGVPLIMIMQVVVLFYSMNFSW